LRASAGLAHPFDGLELEEAVTEAIEVQLRLGPSALAELREEYLSRWERRAIEIDDIEQDLHDRLHEDVRGIVAGKRMLLLAEMLDEAGVPNSDLLITCMSEGFPLTGALPSSGLLAPRGPQSPPLPRDELRRRAPVASRHPSTSWTTTARTGS
jgi:hypothetical protein